MTITNKQKIFCGATLAVIAVIGCGYLLVKKTVPHDPNASSVAGVEKSQDVGATVASEDENLANLYAIDEMVYRITYHSDYGYEDEDGQQVAIVRDVIHKISVTPTLQVTFFEGMTGNNSQDGVIDEPGKDTPNYTIYHDDGTTTNYAYGIEDTKQWYVGESDDVYYGLDAEHRIAHTWTVRERPTKISEGVYQAADYEPGNSTYTFYFDADHQLERVEWYNPDTNDTDIYVLLNEPVVTEVPADIVANAVPFEI
ncbi:hypothetical protein IJJ08_02640 [bacterium]|nr:hypothetical protein [bacterium]